mgnify:FL=1
MAIAFLAFVISCKIKLAMETYQNYKGYGITYYEMSGTTRVDKWGFMLASFPRLGEMKGLDEAKKYIDKLSA